MILLDSVYINNGGGLILLKYLVDMLIQQNKDVYYLFDERTEEVFKNFDIEKKFIANKMSLRKKFYEQNSENFSSVLCFGNVPPPIKLNSNVLVYFHQPLFLKIPSEFSLKNKIIYKAKQIVLSYYKKNADIWLTQSKLIQESFTKKYLKNDPSSVKILPFYPPLNFDERAIKRQRDSFLYVSNAAPHKNHEKLIAAFCNVFDKTQKGVLTVTIPKSSVNLCELIDEKNRLNYPIINAGFIDRNELVNLYLSHEYLVFPSLAESLGLGLAEAVDAGCKVLVSDLPYAYQVCDPSLTFNPHTVESIESCIITAITQELSESNKIIPNDINQLISLLSE